MVNKQTMPWHTLGEKDELALYFDENKQWKYNYSNIFQPMDGFQVLIHNPDEFITRSSYHMFHKYTIFSIFEITPEITLIDDELKSWSVQERNCYLRGEKKLEYFKIYTKSNCEQECLSMATYDACGCVPFFLIRTFIRKLLFQKLIDINWPIS